MIQASRPGLVFKLGSGAGRLLWWSALAVIATALSYASLVASGIPYTLYDVNTYPETTSVLTASAERRYNYTTTSPIHFADDELQLTNVTGYVDPLLSATNQHRAVPDLPAPTVDHHTRDLNDYLVDQYQQVQAQHRKMLDHRNHLRYRPDDPYELYQNQQYGIDYDDPPIRMYDHDDIQHDDVRRLSAPSDALPERRKTPDYDPNNPDLSPTALQDKSRRKARQTYITPSRQLKNIGWIMWAILFIAVGTAIGYMMGNMGAGRNNDEASLTRGPYWDPSGNVLFRSWVREVHAWLNVTSGRATPQQQAAALQRGLGGLARTLAMRVPSNIINFGVEIDGVRTDPVTYLMFYLSIKFEHLEDERQLAQGTELIDFRVPSGERIDATLARFEVARLEAASVGFDIPNFQLLTMVLFRALGVSSSRALNLLQPLQNRMPATQEQYIALLERMRSMGHVLERSPGNIGTHFGNGRGGGGQFMTETLHTASGDAAPQGAYQSPNAPTPSPWADDGPAAYPTNTYNNWTGQSLGWGSPVRQETSATQPTTSL